MCKNIKHKDRLTRYLEVFNVIKLKYTGIRSKYTVRNKEIVSAWNKCVTGMKDPDIDELAKDIVKAIYASVHSDWHKETKYKYITPQFFLRDNKREYWLNEYITNHHKPDTKPFNKQRFV